MEPSGPKGLSKRQGRWGLLLVALLALACGLAASLFVTADHANETARGGERGVAGTTRGAAGDDVRRSHPGSAAAGAEGAPGERHPTPEEVASPEPGAPQSDRRHVLVGRVYQESDRSPVAGALVSVSPLGAKDGPSAPPVGEASTDQAGIFRVADLSAGEFLVSAQARGARGDGESCRVPSSGDPIECEVAVYPAPSIEGRVVDDHGAPVEGAEVVAALALEGVRLSRFRPGRFTARSGADGHFSLVAHMGFFVVTARKGAAFARLAGQLTLDKEDRLSGLVLVLRAEATIGGRATAARSGDPLPGVSVAVTEEEHDSVLARAVTGEDGRYTAGGLSAGIYVVTASAEGMTPVTRKAVGLVAGARATVDFELSGAGGVEGTARDAAGRAVTGAKVVLVAADESRHTTTTGADGYFVLEKLPAGEAQLAAMSVPARFHATAKVDVEPDRLVRQDLAASALATLFGHVLGSDGQPSRQKVTVRSACRDFDEKWTTQAAPDGAYRLEVAPGSAWVLAKAADGREARAYPTLAPGESKQLDLKLALKQEEGAEVLVAGTVLEPTGAPSVAAQVTAMGIVDFTNADGRFSIVSPGGPRAGALTVEARNRGRTGRVAGVQGGRRDVVVKLEAGARLAGKALLKAPVDKIRVQVTRLGGADAEVVAEFPGAAFEFDELPPGRARVAVAASAGVAGDAIVELFSGKATSVEIPVRESGRASGLAVDASSGAPVKGCSVRLRLRGEDAQIASVETDASGRFQLEGLSSGGYAVLLECSAPSAYGGATFALAPGQTLDLGAIRLTPPAPGRIGVTFGWDGPPVVETVEAGGPAERGGVLAGDLMVKVDGTTIYTVTEAMMKVRGEAGTLVRIGVKREEKELQFELVREALPER